MFGKLLTWLTAPFRRRPPEDRFDLYDPQEKTVYQYHNGQRLVAADPIVLYKRYMDVVTDLDQDLMLARSMHSKAAEGHRRAMTKVRQIFRIQPPPAEDEADCSGTLDETKLAGLLWHFLRYCGEVKKNLPTPATSSTATSPPTPPSPAAAPPTSSSSASGSTGEDNCTVGPTPSPSEPPSPSAGSSPDLNSAAT